MSIPITNGSGQSSVAAEAVSGLQYQQVEVYGAGGASVLGVNPDGSLRASIIGIPTVLVGGSVTAISTAAANQSVSGTVGASVIGNVNTTITSIATAGGAIPVTFSAAANQSVSGTVGASVIGTVQANIATINGTTPLMAAQALGVSTTNTSVITVNQSSSIIAVATGSVVALPTGNQSVSGALFISGSVLLGSSNASVIATLQNSSIIAINAGSVVTISQGSVINVLQAPSIVGTYAEDAAHATGDKGMFVMQVRNDTMSSVTSADGDYSPIAGGPVGETIVANAPITKWVRGTADLRGAGSSGVSVIALSAAGSSIFTYVTGVQVANMGSASVLVTLASGGSILGYTIAPAGGGSNIVYPNALKTPANFGFAASISGAASVLVSAQGFTSKT